MIRFYLFLFTLIVIGPTNTVGQNLVRNPSFEERVYCPPQVGDNAFPCLHWSVPTFSTPDYFHECSRAKEFGVPINWSGTYTARTGVAYMGMIFFENETGSLEHIRGELKEPLVEGEEYIIGFYVLAPDSFTNYYTWNIGAYLSQEYDVFGERDFAPVNFSELMYQYPIYPDASNPPGAYLKENEWVRVQDTIVAKGGEEYITIGFFLHDELDITDLLLKYNTSFSRRAEKRIIQRIVTSTLISNKNGLRYDKGWEQSGSLAAYYLIDDVSVSLLDRK